MNVQWMSIGHGMSKIFTATVSNGCPARMFIGRTFLQLCVVHWTSNKDIHRTCLLDIHRMSKFVNIVSSFGCPMDILCQNLDILWIYIYPVSHREKKRAPTIKNLVATTGKIHKIGDRPTFELPQLNWFSWGVYMFSFVVTTKCLCCHSHTIISCKN